MPSINKQCCPTCKRSINPRVIPLFSGLVAALFTVFRYCRRHDKQTFTRAEVKSLFKNENTTCRFADLTKFGNLLRRRAPGVYELNFAACEAFFGGNLAIPTVIVKDPLTGVETPENYKYIDGIKNLSDFLDANRKFISEYRSTPAPLF